MIEHAVNRSEMFRGALRRSMTRLRPQSHAALMLMLLLLLLPLIQACAGPAVTPENATSKLAAPSEKVIAEFAPTGPLRAAINFGNPILAKRDPRTGQASGVSVDLAQALAQRLNRPLRIVTYDSAGQVFTAIKESAWDVAFLAIDPARASEISFSPAYVMIEGAYLVRNESPIRTNAEVDRPGVRVVVGRGSAYDLYLSREFKQASLAFAPTSPAVTDVMMAQKLEVAAGVKQQLQADSRRHPGTRLLPGSFMTINQAMGTPHGREAASRYLGEFVEAMKANGFVAQALQRHSIEGATIAPARRAP